MTQDDYKLWTGETVSYSETDWQRIVNVAKTRLASFLCLESWPEQVADDLEMLLANFICAVLRSFVLTAEGAQRDNSSQKNGK